MGTKSHIAQIKRAATFAALLFVALAANAQEHFYGLDKAHKIADYTQEKIHRAEEIISKRLDEKDSIYVTPNIYNMTVMTQYSYNYEYYRFTATDGGQSIAFRPDNGNKVGLYIGWKWIFLGWSFDLTRNNAKKDINLSFYTTKLGFDIFYRRRDKGFNIDKLDGFANDNGPIEHYNHKFDGLSTMQKGVNIYYIFNNKRFSYPAAYSQSTNQRISAGSFILGLSYNTQSFKLNYTALDNQLQSNINPELRFNVVHYKDYSISFGYSYNWVFAKNCLANLSITPGIGYKNSSLRLKSGKEFLSNINADLVTRAAVVYNNQRFYAGASLISHSYTYRKSNLSVVNGFGTINVYVGVNFWRNNKRD